MIAKHGEKAKLFVKYCELTAKKNENRLPINDLKHSKTYY